MRSHFFLYKYRSTDRSTDRTHTTTPSRVCVCVCCLCALTDVFLFVCMLKLIVQRLIDGCRYCSLLLRMPRCVHISQIPTTDEKKKSKKENTLCVCLSSSSSSFINVGILTVCSILPCVKYFTGAVCTFFRLFSHFFSLIFATNHLTCGSQIITLNWK